MSSTLKRPGNQTNKRSITISMALVLLVAAGAGVVARYHSGQQKIPAGQIDFPSNSSIHILGGNQVQGPFEMRLGAAMSTPTGFWPTVFLTIRYPDNDQSPSNSLAKLHTALRVIAGSSESGPELRQSTKEVISRYLTATVQPLGIDGSPVGPPSRFVYNSFFGPDAPFAGVLPTSYSAQTRHLSLDVVENAHPTNRAHWILSELSPAIQYIRGGTPKITVAQLGPIHLEGQALGLPDTDAVDLHRQLQRNSDETHVKSGLPAIECILRATGKNTQVDQWHLVVDRVLPQYIVPTPRMLENASEPESVLAFARMYPLLSETAAASPTCSFYCCPGYPGQQQLIQVGGRIVKLKVGTGTLVFHDLDLIYNPTTGVYDGYWKSPQKQSMAGIVVYALNLIPRKNGKPAPNEDLNTATIRFAYRYPAELAGESVLQPENVPSAELVDPLNPTPPPTSMLRFQAPVYSEQTDMMGGHFDNWFSVYIPGPPPPPDMSDRHDFSRGVRELIRQRCRGALLRITVPKKYLATHQPIHLKSIEIKIVSRSPSVRYPFTLTLPVVQGHESDWVSVLNSGA